MRARRQYNAAYSGQHLRQIAFPMGGIGAGMICLSGRGGLSNFSVRNRPDVFNEPYMYAAVCVKGQPNVARVLEGPVAQTEAFGAYETANGAKNRSYGLPRFAKASFRAHFPFATVTLNDAAFPLRVKITGWSPFIPADPDNSSLPVAAIEYTFTNLSDRDIEFVYSYNSRNSMAIGNVGSSITAGVNGFILRQAASEGKPWERGDFCISADAEDVQVNHAWFRGGWFDAQTMAWADVMRAEPVSRPPVTDSSPPTGASLYVPVRLAGGQSRTIRLMLSWYVPESGIRRGKDTQSTTCGTEGACACNAQPAALPTYQPWYAARFSDIESVAAYWRQKYAALRRKSMKFSRAFYDSTLPPEVIEAVAANLTILKSPTCLRQTDGRFWAYEGCCDAVGCCDGSCTHVWNYAQALPHLFPSLERSLRQTEFNESQDERGHQQFRASLPIRPTLNDYHAAADGQLGGIMKVYREWRISGDTDWLCGNSGPRSAGTPRKRMRHASAVTCPLSNVG